MGLLPDPDTEVVDGTLGDLVRAAGQFPEAGVFGVRQVNGQGKLEPSMRRFPHPARWFLEALGSGRWARDGRWSGQRVRKWGAHDTYARCDWTSGSAMLVRDEVLRATGGMDESFFLFSEEPDLSLRALRAGWTTLHLPVSTVVHYGGNEAANVRMSAATRRFAKPVHVQALLTAGARARHRSVGPGLRPPHDQPAHAHPLVGGARVDPRLPRRPVSVAFASAPLTAPPTPSDQGAPIEGRGRRSCHRRGRPAYRLENRDGSPPEFVVCRVAGRRG